MTCPVRKPPIAASLAIDPGRQEALLGLGALLVAQARGEDAKELLKFCCGLAPTCDQAWDALGLALLLTQENGLAEAAFERARRIKPHQIDYALHSIEAAIIDGRAEDALLRMQAEAAADPLNAAVLTAQGELLNRLDRRAEAIDLFEAAATLAPDARVPAAKRAMALARSLRQHEAEPAMRAALALDPDDADLGIAFSIVLLRLQRHTEAHALLLDLHREAWRGCCAAVQSRNGLDRAGPAGGSARAKRSGALRSRRIMPAPGARLPIRCPIVTALAARPLLEVARATAERLPRRPPEPFGNAPDPDRKLRIGLLSGMLKVHPVGWMTVAGFEALDRRAFELVCFSQQTATDIMAQRFYRIAENHDVFAVNDAALAGFVREQAIDIMIDLGGYGDFGRMASCAQRLAPVQVKWVGMQNASTGMPEMDWMVADRWEIPEGFEQYYSEKPLRLADGYIVYSPPANAPDVAPLPALRNGHITFGCYNNLAKITPEVIAAWAGIMQRVPGSRIVLKTHQFSEPGPRVRITDVFAIHGIAAERVTLRGSSPHRALLREYGDIDIVLDPFPYSGGLTTCEALWMGVPTVTCPGEIFASRHSCSHLSNVGLTDWIASDLDAYADLAVAKASDVRALAAVRDGLRAQVKASPLCDGPRFGRSLGEGLRFAWREWCSRQEG